MDIIPGSGDFVNSQTLINPSLEMAFEPGMPACIMVISAVDCPQPSAAGQALPRTWRSLRIYLSDMDEVEHSGLVLPGWDC